MCKTFVKLKVFGGYACFSRPEMKVERVSYEVMTPSAARGILEAILWKPQFRWVIRSIKVLKPIRFQMLKRNELQTKIKPGTVKTWMKNPKTFSPQVAGAGTKDATPRSTLALRDVAYIIEAEPLVFEPNNEDTATKYMCMFNRRVEKGQCYHQPFFGCREFVANFEPANEGEEAIMVTQDIGMMLYDIIFRSSKNIHEDYDQNTQVFFKAKLENGILNTNPEEVITDEKTRQELLQCSYIPATTGK